MNGVELEWSGGLASAFNQNCLFQRAFKMALRRAGLRASGEARARRISAAICNERATKPEAQRTSELVTSCTRLGINRLILSMSLLIVKM